MSHAEKLQAVRDRLKLWTNPLGVTIVGVNEPFDDTPNYLRVWLLEGGSVNQGFGGSHHVTNRHTGVLQLSVYTEMARGEGYGLDIAQGAAEMFRNKKLSGIRFRAVTIRPQPYDENHMRHDATLPYYWDEQVTVELIE